MRRLAQVLEGRLHYCWIVTGLTFVVMLVAAAARSASGVLVVPLEQGLGWGRATVSLAMSVNLLAYGFAGPFAASLMNRYGVRRTLIVALSAAAVGVGLTATVTAPWQLILLWGMVVGTATGTAAQVLGATVVSRWFVERRGLAMGILTASNATGQLIFLPVLAALVQRYGWQSALILVASVATAIIPLVAILMWDRPSDLGLRPYGEIAATNSPTPLSSPTNQRPLQVLRRGMASADFWRLFASFCICGMSTAGLIATHLIPGCIDHGIPEIKAAGLLATIAAFDLIGTTASGWASDRWDNRRLLFWCYGLRGLSLLLLPYAFDWSYGLLIFAAFYGFDWIATVPPTVRLLGDLFGRDDGPLLFGWVVVGHQLGAGLAAYGAGWIRVDRGEYSAAFVLTGLLCMLAAVLSIKIGKPTQHQPASVAEMTVVPEIV